MRYKLTLAALALSVAPTFALAQGCDHARQTSAAVCAVGMMWDLEKGTCVPTPSS